MFDKPLSYEEQAAEDRARDEQAQSDADRLRERRREVSALLLPLVSQYATGIGDGRMPCELIYFYNKGWREEAPILLAAFHQRKVAADMLSMMESGSMGYWRISLDTYDEGDGREVRVGTIQHFFKGVDVETITLSMNPVAARIGPEREIIG